MSVLSEGLRGLICCIETRFEGGSDLSEEEIVEEVLDCGMTFLGGLCGGESEDAVIVAAIAGTGGRANCAGFGRFFSAVFLPKMFFSIVAVVAVVAVEIFEVLGKDILARTGSSWALPTELSDFCLCEGGRR